MVFRLRQTMVTTQFSFIGIGNFPAFQPPFPSLRCRNGRPFFRLISSSSSKEGSSDDPDARHPPSFALRVPNPTLARSAIALFGFGFIDAGYSGDWSRIGVISQETEDFLKFAVFIVIPLCLLLLLSIAPKSE